MFPELLHIGPLTIHTYGALLALGAGLGLWLLARLSRARGLDADRVVNLALWCLLAGLLGSRLLFVALEPQGFNIEFWRIFAVWEGGLVFYGGILLGLPVAVLLIRRWKLPVLTLLDCAAPAVILGQFFGRLGCFSAGCCYGRLCDLPWAVTFTDPLTLAPRGLSLHPTQLYHALALAVMLVVALWLWRKKLKPGVVFFTYGLMHGVARVIIEQFRADFRGEPLLGPLTPTAVFALVLALECAAALVYIVRKPGPEQGEQS